VQNETASQARILIVDEDSNIRMRIVNYLSEYNMIAQSTAWHRGIAGHLSGWVPDLVILGVGRDQDQGLHLLKVIRSHSDVPIIVAEGHESGDPCFVSALDLGADGYLSYPIALRELLARIRAVFRRENSTQRARRNNTQIGYRFAGWQLDTRNRSLSNPNGVPVRLTRREYALLVALLNSPRQALSRTQLLDAMRMHDDVFERCVDVCISRLRRKVEIEPNAPRIIETARGFGYQIGLPVAPF
jgi:two-component system OmpR family response regulator